MAADQGYPTAQINLGFIYKRGLDVPQDYSETRHADCTSWRSKKSMI